MKSGDDKLAVRAVIGLTCIVIMAIPAALVGPPPAGLLPWLAASVALHIGYQLVLVRSYAISDYSLAFPIARGTAPVVTTVAAALFIAELPGPAALAGIGMIALGMLLLCTPAALSRAGLAAALITGLFTAAYTLVDAVGVRSAPRPIDFIAWFFVAEGAVITAVYLAIRRRRAWSGLKAHARPGIAAGVVALAGFGATLWALSVAPVAVVSGLRETSVLFALLFAGRLLEETTTPRKVVAALSITLGAVAILLWTA